MPSLVEPQQQELAQVGDQHLAVGFEVAEHLLRSATTCDVVAGRLDLDGAPGRLLAAERAQVGVAAGGRDPGGLGHARAPHLVGREQAAVGQTGAPILEVHEATDLGLEPAADLFEKRAQRRVVRKLRDALARKLRVP